MLMHIRNDIKRNETSKIEKAVLNAFMKALQKFRKWNNFAYFEQMFHFVQLFQNIK